MRKQKKWRDFYYEKNNNGKEILKLLQENYEINTAKDLLRALKDNELMPITIEQVSYSSRKKKTKKE